MFLGEDEPDAFEDRAAFEGVSEHDCDADHLQRGGHELGHVAQERESGKYRLTRCIEDIQCYHFVMCKQHNISNL